MISFCCYARYSISRHKLILLSNPNKQRRWVFFFFIGFDCYFYVQSMHVIFLWTTLYSRLFISSLSWCTKRRIFIPIRNTHSDEAKPFRKKPGGKDTNRKCAWNHLTSWWLVALRCNEKQMFTDGLSRTIVMDSWECHAWPAVKRETPMIVR